MVLINAFEAALKSFKGEWREDRHRHIANGTQVVASVNFPGTENIRGDYFVTSDSGVYGIQGGKVFRLFAADTFGLALRDGELFVSTSTDKTSRIVKTRLDLPLRAGHKLRFKEIFAAPTTKKGRFHQIAFYNNFLAICHTSANCILLVDPDSGALQREIFPFQDNLGGKINFDHNHINSVSHCGDTLLFCAYRAGSGALLGVIHDSKLKGYRIQHAGAHDVHVSGRDIYYSDTFGGKEGPNANCGYLIRNGRKFDPDAFTTPTGYAVRGLAQSVDELLIGHSNKGERRKRFSGSGALLRCVGHKMAQEVTMPFAQVYDIIEMSGRHFNEAPSVKTWEEVNALFESVFGNPVYEATL